MPKGDGLTEVGLLRISDGSSDGLWRPHHEVTRAQYAKFVVKAFGLTSVAPDAPTFSDVPPTHALYGCVEAAAAAGIVNGRGDGLFAPDASITRQEAAAILVRYLVVKNGRNLDSVMPEDVVATQLGFFADGDQVADSLRKEVALAIARNAVKGSASGDSLLLRPNAPLLRIQGAALATRQEKPGLSTLVGDTRRRRDSSAL